MYLLMYFFMYIDMITTKNYDYDDKEVQCDRQN